MSECWVWDDSLYKGSAQYYARGRLPYAPGLSETLRDSLRLDGTGRLIDVGCGPGTVTVLLAPLFEEAVGIDPDVGMIEEATRSGTALGLSNVRWIRLRAEDLPAGLGIFRVATFAQSFHWMRREQVAMTIHDMLLPGGWFVQVSDVKETLAAPAGAFPEPPTARIRALVRDYLGEVRRAGQGSLPQGTPSDEGKIIAKVGFRGPRRVRVPGGALLNRSTDDVLASVYSRSDSAPHLFGNRLGDFDSDLRQLLVETAPEGRFIVIQPDNELFFWEKVD